MRPSNVATARGLDRPFRRGLRAGSATVVLALLLWLIGCAVGNAQAGVGASTVDPAARAAFQAGADAYERGSFGEALLLFRRANELSPHPKLLFNIARAADSDGQVDVATEAYEAYLEAMPGADNRAFVEARVRRLRHAGQLPVTPEAHGNANAPPLLRPTPEPSSQPAITAEAESSEPPSMLTHTVGPQEPGSFARATADVTRNPRVLADSAEAPRRKRLFHWTIAGALVVAAGVVATTLLVRSSRDSEPRETLGSTGIDIKIPHPDSVP